eukprot:gene5945-9774_t
MSKLEIIHEEFNNKLDKENLSEPESVEFPTTFNGKETTSFGFFYPPKNANYEGIEGSKPPLLCKIHSGLTAAANSVLNLSIQYWTSHGFAVMDLNYEGVDSEKVCIDRGSAGGFSTLACLAFTNVFKAGYSLYGASDLEVLASDTHKFEARYLDLLVDSYDPKSENKKYKERSPIHHCEKIEAPIILLQGLEDKFVPSNQAEMFYKAVKEKGLPKLHHLIQFVNFNCDVEVGDVVLVYDPYRALNSPVVIIADCGGGDYLLNQLTRYNQNDLSKLSKEEKSHYILIDKDKDIDDGKLLVSSYFKRGRL